MVAASSNVQSDGLHLALFLIGALLVWRALERGTLRYGVGAGIVCGLAYLTRPEGLAVGVVLGGWLLADLATKRIGWQRFLRAAGGFAIAVLLFGGPYALSLSAGGGEVVLSQKKSLMPAGLEVFSFGRLAPAFWEVMRDFQQGWEAFWLFVVLAFRWQRPSRATLYLASFTLLFFVLLIAVHLEAGYISRRHWLAPAALLFPFAALGILRVGDLARDWLSGFGGSDWVPAACVTAVVAGFVGHELMRPPEAVKLARKEAALWLRQYDVEAVSAERARSAYYAGADRHIPLVAVSDPILLRDRLRLAGAEFVIAEETALPALPAEGIPGLSQVHRVPYPGGHVLVLRIDAPRD
jgi:hypothetical protein